MRRNRPHAARRLAAAATQRAAQIAVLRAQARRSLYACASLFLVENRRR